MSGLLQHRRKSFRGTGAAPAAFDGFGNRSRSFDGVDDVIDLGNTNSRTTNQTFCAWVKADAFDSTFGNSYFSKWDGNILNGKEWLLWLSWVTPMKPEFRITQSNGTVIICTSPTNIVLNQWTHIAGVVDANNIYLYIDGSLVATTAYDGTNSVASNSIATIGGMNYSATNSHNASGNISDCRIYDTDLTASKISDIYNGTDVQTNLVGHWLTDADDTEDKAGSNNGTNYGSKYSYDNPSPPVEFGSASRSFDGLNSRIEIADNNDHNFGDGVNDSPFSASAWIKIEATSKAFRILCKWSDPAGPEWAFTTDSSDRLSLFLKDVSTNALIKRYYSVNMSAYLDQWVYVAATYDGRGGVNAADGIELYLNSVQVDDTNGNSGTYTAMENTTSPTYIGTVETISGYSTAQGKIADVRLYDTHLTASQISDLYAGKDVQTNLVGHWLTDNDDVEDKAGTNNGTNFGSLYDYDAPFTEVTLPNHFWNLSDTGTYADSGKLASAGWDLNEYSSVSSSVQSIGTSTKTVLDTTSGGVLEYKNGASVDVGWDSESKEVSMACWFYCDSFSSSGNWLISWRGNNIDNKIAQLFIRNDAGLQILRGTMWDAQGDSALTPQSGTSISLNTWYHGALTWDNTTLKVYIDGELFASATNASVDGFGTNTSGCEFAIAGGSWDKNGTSVQHKGYTFGAGVWDVALTENQIKALYNDGNALDYSETTWR